MRRPPSSEDLQDNVNDPSQINCFNIPSFYKAYNEIYQYQDKGQSVVNISYTNMNRKKFFLLIASSHCCMY